jgi:hypothetical protein
MPGMAQLECIDSRAHICQLHTLLSQVNIFLVIVGFVCKLDISIFQLGTKVVLNTNNRIGRVFLRKCKTTGSILFFKYTLHVLF